MDRGKYHRAVVSFDEPAALNADPEVFPKYRLRRRRAKQDNDARLDGGNLGVEPRLARAHLAPARLLVDAARASAQSLEVLHNIGEVDGTAVNANFHHLAVQQPPCRTHERLPGQVLFVTRLLSNKHDARSRRTIPTTRRATMAIYVRVMPRIIRARFGPG